jgi:acyl carrier protein
MKERLKQYVTEQLLGDHTDAEVGEDDDLLGSGLVDSVAMMSLVLFIEEELHIPVPPEDVTIEHFRSIRTIDAYLQQREA